MVGDGGRSGYTIYHISNVLQDSATKSYTLTYLLDTFHCVTFDGYAFQLPLAASTGQVWFECSTNAKSSTSVTDMHLDANSQVVAAHKHPRHLKL